MVDDLDSDEPVTPPPSLAEPTTSAALARAWSAAQPIPPQEGFEEPSPDPAAVAQELGLPRLPPSYLEYIHRFRALGELKMKYRREGFPFFLNVLPPSWLTRIGEYFREGFAPSADITPEAVEKAKALRVLVPFGNDTSRTSICWDPARATPEGELWICLVDSELWTRTDVGHDLTDILKYYAPSSLTRR
jgi:hypothetical protein